MSFGERSFFRGHRRAVSVIVAPMSKDVSTKPKGANGEHEGGEAEPLSDKGSAPDALTRDEVAEEAAREAPEGGASPAGPEAGGVDPERKWLAEVYQRGATQL